MRSKFRTTNIVQDLKRTGKADGEAHSAQEQGANREVNGRDLNNMTIREAIFD
jgi:hypothetical protein